MKRALVGVCLIGIRFTGAGMFEATWQKNNFLAGNDKLYLPIRVQDTDSLPSSPVIKHVKLPTGDPIGIKVAFKISEVAVTVTDSNGMALLVASSVHATTGDLTLLRMTSILIVNGDEDSNRQRASSITTVIRMWK